MPPSAERPIIIKKIKKKAGHGHHGGAWKVAYADFVTAMMAFFLMLWLLNSTSQEQKEGISNYFAPSSVSATQSGSGGILAGRSLDSQGALQSPMMPMVNPAPAQEGVQSEEAKEESVTKGSSFDPAADPAMQEAQEKMRAEDEKNFDAMENRIRMAIKDDKELAGLAENLLFEKTKDGLRIHLIDQDKRPLFASGSREPMEYTRKLVGKVAEIVRTLPNALAISGHTDGQAFRSGLGYTNWELSADRANATRRMLLAKNIGDNRIASVEGKADRDPLIKKNPMAPANRRISITLLYRDVRQQQLQPDAPNAPIEDGVFR